MCFFFFLADSGLGLSWAPPAKLGPHLSPATREERCCHKCKECRFQAFLLWPGACMHPTKGGYLDMSCFDMFALVERGTRLEREFKKTSHHRTIQGYSSGQCTLGWLHTRWRTRLLKNAEQQEEKRDAVHNNNYTINLEQVSNLACCMCVIRLN